MTYTMNRNPDFGSLEIRFDSMPTAAVRTALKSMRFRWHCLNRYWYGKADENAVRETLDKLISRAEKIQAANTKRKPVPPTPKTNPAPALTVLSAEPENEPEPEPEPDPTPVFPKREDLKPLSFSYRIGSSVGQAAFSLDLLSAANASTLKVMLPMIGGIEDDDVRKQAYFTLAALAWYDAKDDPERKPRFRQLADLYREKTGEPFPAPSDENEKPAAVKTVTAACKRIMKNSAFDDEKGVLRSEDWSLVSDGFRIVALRSASLDLPAPTLCNPDRTSRAIEYLAKAENECRGEKLTLPAVKDLKAWIKAETAANGKRGATEYDLGGVWVNPKYLLDMLEALPGCEASRPDSLYQPILFRSGKDLGVLMQVRHTETKSAETAA